jgi:hypothetical protein
MAAAVAIGGSVFTAVALFSSARTLYGGAFIRRGFGYRLSVATIAAYLAVVDFAKTAVRFAAVATAAQQLNVRGFVATPARKGHNVVEFEVFGPATTLANASIAGKNDALGAL